ncbi:MAG TPA: cation:proton antiporter [Ktedonobacteraceae bacterium]|nr:cation:proton antiporter [Ktedonobacteraceae bacterium]
MLTSQIFLQLIVILLAVQVFGYLCQCIGQPRVIGEILAGLALGPTLLGAVLPRVEASIFPISALPTLQTLGDIGLVLYMFSLGTHIDTHAMLKQGRKAAVVSLSGVLLPLALGGAFAFFLYPEFAGSKANLVSFMLLVGTAMAITAFPVLARILEEKGMLATRIGVLALVCAAIDDVVGWCLLALLIAFIHATGAASVAMTIAFLGFFVGVMLGVVRPLLLFADRHLKSKPALMVLTMVLLLSSAYATNAIGIHPVFGAFMMGIILPRRTVYIEQVQYIDQVNNLLFLPLYFVYNGLRTHIGLINSPALWLLCGLVLIVACLGKVLGGSLSLKVLGESWKESLTLGTLMNTRGLVELIVLNIGLDLGVISPTFFAMLVMMAVVTTMMTPPLLSFLGFRQKQVREQEAKETDPTDYKGLLTN